MTRFFIVLDLDPTYPCTDQEDVAVDIEAWLARHPVAAATTYASLDDIVLDRAESVGPFHPDHPNQEVPA